MTCIPPRRYTIGPFSWAFVRAWTPVDVHRPRVHRSPSTAQWTHTPSRTFSSRADRDSISKAPVGPRVSGTKGPRRTLRTHPKHDRVSAIGLSRRLGRGRGRDRDLHERRHGVRCRFGFDPIAMAVEPRAYGYGGCGLRCNWVDGHQAWKDAVKCQAQRREAGNQTIEGNGECAHRAVEKVNVALKY